METDDVPRRDVVRCNLITEEEIENGRRPSEGTSSAKEKSNMANANYFVLLQKQTANFYQQIYSDGVS